MLGKVVVWRKCGLGLNDVWKFVMGGMIWKCPKGDDLIGHWTLDNVVDGGGTDEGGTITK